MFSSVSCLFSRKVMISLELPESTLLMKTRISQQKRWCFEQWVFQFVLYTSSSHLLSTTFFAWLNLVSKDKTFLFFIFKCKYKPVWVKYISLGVFYFLSLGGRALILIETLSLLRNKSCSMVARPDLRLKQMIWHSQPGNQMKIQTYFSKKWKSEPKRLNEKTQNLRKHFSDVKGF